MSLKVTCSLSAGSIDSAIQEIKRFKADFLSKVDTYRERLATEISNRAQIGFTAAIADDIIHGGIPRSAQVSCRVEPESGNVTVVVADGEDAVWVEFGAGVYHGGAAGSSPNPYGADLGFTIGTYGKGHGANQAWGYYPDGDPTNGVVVTRGTPPAMPMYNAVQEVLRISVELAREVFN